MTLCSDRMLISHRCIRGLVPNLIKKSWTVSNIPYGFHETNYFSSVDIVIIIAGPTSVSYREIDYDSFSSSALKKKNWEDLPGD